MTDNEKISLIAATLEAKDDSITAETELATLDGWDSMGMIAIMAVLDNSFDRKLTVQQIHSFCKIEDILEQMSAK